MLKEISAKLFKESFAPGLIGIFINPFYFGRKEMYNQIKSISQEFNGKILDVGCGRKPYKHLFKYDDYIGIDMPNTGHIHKNSQIDIFYDGKNFPFDDETFDNVIMTEVLEHIFNPDEIMLEINRVLKNQGKLLITIPFLWIEHEEPFDYARYTSFAIEHILNKNGFSIIYQKKILNDIRCLVQLFTTYLLNKSLNDKLWKRTLKTIFFVSPFTIITLIFYKFFPKVSNLYLNNVIVAKKIT